jgi:hypothetical protein
LLSPIDRSQNDDLIVEALGPTRLRGRAATIGVFPIASTKNVHEVSWLGRSAPIATSTDLQSRCQGVRSCRSLLLTRLSFSGHARCAKAPDEEYAPDLRSLFPLIRFKRLKSSGSERHRQEIKVKARVNSDLASEASGGGLILDDDALIGLPDRNRAANSSAFAVARGACALI